MSFNTDAEKHSSSSIKKYKYLFIIGGVVAAILIVGYLFSGGTTPNSSIGSVFSPPTVYKSNLGAINGYVYGPLGLPAVGSTVIAAEQGGSASTQTAFISVDGKYVFSDMEPGTYILMVAFPDGANKVLNDVNVGRGSIQTINFNY